MNKLMMIVTLMVVACGLMSEAQVQQEGTESLDQERRLERLRAQDRELDELRALLQAERIRQNRLDRDEARRDRTNTGSAFNFGDVFQSESALNFQQYDNEIEVSDLDATADVSSKNKFGLQVVSENSFDESASISTNDGSRSQSGTLLQAQENIDAETAVQDQEIDQSEFVEDNNLSRAEAARDALNAEEAARTALEASLDAERQQESRNFFQDLSVFDDNFGGNNFGGNFGGNVFGRRGGRNNIFGGRGLFNF